MTIPSVMASASDNQLGAPDKPEKAADKGDKMICKRFVETGSLVSTYRSCKTKRDWERVRDNNVSMRSSNTCGVLGGCP
jgi:hypothetical protein